ncbi:hypothetical protein KAZ57_00910 [Patescibacteria group bacterium]|nr:hypothetical protein [Patescibacteria group bacterium]
MEFINDVVILATILATTFSVVVGVFSVYRNPRSKIAFLWLLTTLSIATWGIGYTLTLFSNTPEQASLYLKMVYFGATLAPILTFHFIAAFLYKTIQLKYLLALGYMLSGMFIFLTTSTDLIISGVQYMKNFGHYEEVTAVGFKFYLSYFLLFVFASVWLLVQGYRNSSGAYQRKIKYLLLALVIGFVGSMSNFLTDLTGVYPYGQMIVWLYPLLVTWGIFFEGVKIKVIS